MAFSSSSPYPVPKLSATLPSHPFWFSFTSNPLSQQIHLQVLCFHVLRSSLFPFMNLPINSLSCAFSLPKQLCPHPSVPCLAFYALEPDPVTPQSCIWSMCSQLDSMWIISPQKTQKKSKREDISQPAIKVIQHLDWKKSYQTSYFLSTSLCHRNPL